ncbi:MAG: glycosyltransferase family 39 protein [Anaerolineales bacterium]|nr:glycosyltransferase family 39 protein [Anaerolineales bacterium]
MIDLSDPPLDFHPTRQFRGAIIARSLYYQRFPSADPFIQQQAVGMRDTVGDFEPPILESMVAMGYVLAGGEALWVARILTSLVWVLGGIPLYALARRFSSSGAALLSTAYYLFLLFGVMASRSFQPDPLMVASLVAGMYAIHRWSETRAWKWALWAAAFGGFSILVKAFAAYFVLGVFASMVLYTLPGREALRSRQVWAMFALCVSPALLYYFSGDSVAGDYVQNWIVALLPMAFEPGFYIRWARVLNDLLGVVHLVVAASGVLVAPPRARWLLLGAWLGYLVYGITLPHQTLTHNYYHLFAVPLTALSVAPLLQLLVRRIALQGRTWRLAFIGVLLASLFYNAWVARSDMLGVDYREEPVFWQGIGAAVPTDGRTIGLVQSYGSLLSYYGWRTVQLWPITGELELAGLRGSSNGDFEEFFNNRTEGMDYFLVTSFNQLAEQPALAQHLEANYPLHSRGAGYIIYDLRSPR